MQPVLFTFPFPWVVIGPGLVLRARRGGEAEPEEGDERGREAVTTAATLLYSWDGRAWTRRHQARSRSLWGREEQVQEQVQEHQEHQEQEEQEEQEEQVQEQQTEEASSGAVLSGRSAWRSSSSS